MLKLTLSIETSQGAFRSPLVLQVYAVHANQILSVDHRCRAQIGALALAAAAVCGSVYLLQVQDKNNPFI